MRSRFFRFAGKLPGFTAWLRNHRWLPDARYRTGLLAHNGNAATGWLMPQPWVLDQHGATVRLDDLITGRWAIVHTGTEQSWLPWRLAGVPVVKIAAPGGDPGADGIVDRDGRLIDWLAKKKATVLAVRPDGFVYAAGDDAHPLPAPPAGLTVRATRVKDHA
ncbi:MAG: hypothetical protein HY239_13510 [Mycolicibacterium aromaticivorans]|nr:hypothetical protein [Mycolicibacterium aromaticivorans]